MTYIIALMNLFLPKALIGLHAWATTESLEVLGVFGTSFTGRIIRPDH